MKEMPCTCLGVRNLGTLLLRSMQVSMSSRVSRAGLLSPNAIATCKMCAVGGPPSLQLWSQQSRSIAECIPCKASQNVLSCTSSRQSFQNMEPCVTWSCFHSSERERRQLLTRRSCTFLAAIGTTPKLGDPAKPRTRATNLSRSGSSRNFPCSE